MEQWNNGITIFFRKRKKKFENKNIFFQNFSKFLQVYIKHKHKHKHKFYWTFSLHTERQRDRHTYSSYIAAHRS